MALQINKWIAFVIGRNDASEIHIDMNLTYGNSLTQTNQTKKKKTKTKKQKKKNQNQSSSNCTI